MLGFLRGSDTFEDISKVDACEQCGGDASSTPGETKRLLNNVLFFTTVTGTDQSDWNGHDLELGAEIGKAQRDRG